VILQSHMLDAKSPIIHHIQCLTLAKKLNTNGVPIISKKTMQTFEHHADVIKKPNTEHFD